MLNSAVGLDPAELPKLTSCDSQLGLASNRKDIIKYETM
jgi:hypothetical protein